jgi:hypothetical protein
LVASAQFPPEFGREKAASALEDRGVIWGDDREIKTAPTAITSGGWGVTIGTAAFPEGKAVSIIAPQPRHKHQTYAIGKWRHACPDYGAAAQ